MMVRDDEKDAQQEQPLDTDTTPEVSATMQFLQAQEEEKNDSAPEVSSQAIPETTEQTDEPEEREDLTAAPTDATQTEEEEEEEESLEDLQEEDFSNWTIEQLTQKSHELVELVKAGGKINFKRVARTLNDLKDIVHEINNKQKEQELADFLAADPEKNTPETFKYTAPPLVDQFFENFKFLRKRQREYYQNLEQQKEQNLLEKKNIVEKIKALTDSIQDPDADNRKDFDKIKDLQEQWKKIGPVPQTDADDLYKTYRAVVDMFYNQKSLEREMLELDRQKNQQSKEEVCQKAEALLQETNTQEAVKAINLLHQEYKNIGPVPKEAQEELWQRFKNASDQIYERKRQEVEAFKQELEANMKAKQELCIEVEAFLEFESDRIKEWNKKTRELQAIQKKWEDIGPAPREVAKSINKQFWNNFKAFFAKKSSFFEQLEAEREENLKKKIALCERVEAIKDGFEWDEITEELKKLQEEWKAIGPVAKTHRDSVYERFKAACDHFFERKRNRKAEQEKEFAYNLEKKRELCQQIETMTAEGQKDLEAFEQICIKFEKAGFVPRKHMERIQEQFVKATDAFFAQLDMGDDEREQFKLQMQFRALGDSPQTVAKFKKQEGGIIRKIEHIRRDIQLWETNLEFFARSKTADKLRQEFEEKIGGAHQEIKELERKLKLIKKIKNGEITLPTKPKASKVETAEEKSE